ncbi:hypothetical protein RKD31_001915 [Streptomyces sp. SAI-163]
MRRVQQGGGLGQGRLATGVQDQPVGRGGTDQLARGALRGGGRLLPVRRGAVLLGRRVDQPGQPVGEALLGERVPLQADQHPDGALLALRDLSLRDLRTGAGLVQGVLEGECLALGERALHGRVGVGDAPLGQGGGQPRQLQRGVPGQGRLLQQPHGDRTAAPLVVRAALRAEQRTGEPVGLLRPHPGDPEQLPGVRAQRVLSALTEERGGLRRERLGCAALRQYAPDRLHGLRRRSRGRRGYGGPLGGRRPGRAYRLRRGTARGLGGAEDRGRRLLTALHRAYGGQQIGRRAAELAARVDRPLLLRLPPLDPLPLDPLRGQLGLALGHLRGRPAPVPGGLAVRLRFGGGPGRLRGARDLRPGVHGVRGVLGGGLGLRAHSVLQS